MDLALTLGIPSVKLNAVLLKQHNQQELNLFLNYLKDKPVTIRFIELMRTGDNRDYFQQQHVSTEAIKVYCLTQGWREIKKTIDAGPAQEFSHPDYVGKLGFIAPYSQEFCQSCNRLRVSATGKLHLCLFAEANHDLRQYLQHNEPQALLRYLQNTVQQKWLGHRLQQEESGLMTHLASLGG